MVLRRDRNHLGEEPAVHGEVCAGDVGGVVGKEEGDCGRDLLGVADAALGDAGIGNALCNFGVAWVSTVSITPGCNSLMRTPCGQIDVLVSNAGYSTFGAVEDLSSEQIRRAINTNLLGSIDVIKAFIPHLRV